MSEVKKRFFPESPLMMDAAADLSCRVFLVVVISFAAKVLIIRKMQAGFFPASLADIMQNGTVHLSLQTLDDVPDITAPLKEDSSSGRAVSNISWQRRGSLVIVVPGWVRRASVIWRGPIPGDGRAHLNQPQETASTHNLHSFFNRHKIYRH